MTKTKFEIGQFVKIHQDYETTDQCFICAKQLKDAEVETRIALTENYTLSTLDAINALAKLGSKGNLLISSPKSEINPSSLIKITNKINFIAPSRNNYFKA